MRSQGVRYNIQVGQGLYIENSGCSGTKANNWQVGPHKTKKSPVQKSKQSLERNNLPNQRNSLPDIHLIEDEHLEYAKISKKSKCQENKNNPGKKLSTDLNKEFPKEEIKWPIKKL